MKEQGALRLSSELRQATPLDVLARALATFHTYHRGAVLERIGARVHVADPDLLFYYRNRIAGYGLFDGIGKGESGREEEVV